MLAITADQCLRIPLHYGIGSGLHVLVHYRIQSGFHILYVPVHVASSQNAARYGVDATIILIPTNFPVLIQRKEYSGETLLVVYPAYLTAAQWIGAHLIPLTLDDLKPFSRQMCSILYRHNLQLNIVPQYP